MTPSSRRRYRRILVDSIWRELMLCGLFFLIGAAAIGQLWEWPKPKIEPIPVKPMQIQLSKEMLVQYQPVDTSWPDPNLWMLSSEGVWTRLERPKPSKAKK